MDRLRTLSVSRAVVSSGFIRARWLLAAGFAIGLRQQPAHADLLIYHLDVGMGDATLFVDSESRKTMLVDAGNVGQRRRAVGPALKVLGIEELDHLIVTHYDADHIGGIPELVSDPIARVAMIGDRGNVTDHLPTTGSGNPSIYGAYLSAAAELGRRQILQPSCTPAIELGQHTTVRVVAVTGRCTEQNRSVQTKLIPKSEDNDLSVALVMEHGDFGYVIAIDLTGGGNGTRDMESMIAGSLVRLRIVTWPHLLKRPMLTLQEKRTAQAIVNMFETGYVLGDYGSVTVVVGDTGYLTCGRSQSTLAS